MDDARQTQLGTAIHGRDEFAEGSGANLDIWVQEQDVASTRLVEGDVVGRGESSVVPAEDPYLAELSLDRVRRAVGRSGIDDQPLHGGRPNSSQRRAQRRQGHLAAVVRDDDDREVGAPGHD